MENIIIEYNDIIKTHKGLAFAYNENDFKEFINGLYQAEGTMGAYFPTKDSTRVVFNLSLGQNYSPESLDVLLNLQKILKIGRVKLEFGNMNQAHLRYIISNTEDIFNIGIPYFSLLYGQKMKDMIILNRIYELSFESDKASTNEIIHLVYSINPSGQKRIVSLIEKLNIFNCFISTNHDIKVKENNTLPSKLFILGLFLGDGSMGFVFDSSRLPKFSMRIVFTFAAQKGDINLLRLVAKKMELKPNIFKRKDGMMSLEYSGGIVFEVIMPFLSEHRNWLFWRKNKFIIAQKISILFSNKKHLTKEGLITIVELLYSIPNKYAKPKEYWIDLIYKRIWK